MLYLRNKSIGSVRLVARRAALMGATAAGLVASPGIALAANAPASLRPPPPMSVPTARYYQAHPAERAAFLKQLAAPATRTPRYVSPSGGTWQAVTTAPAGGLTTPELQTDGTVILHNGNTPYWYRLTPDSSGNYATGTWSALPALPVIGGTQYAPLYHATGVLPDGRTVIIGGEYNGSGTEVWTNLGAIYDPAANSWSALAAPAGSGWSQIGDAESMILSNGTFMLGGCCGDPDVDATLNPTTLTWTTTGAPAAGLNYQDEQGYELLPNNDVLTIDVWTNYPNGNATNAERYVPKSGIWKSAGNTPVSLVDPIACGNFEIGPAVLRGDGTVVGFGGNTGCTTPPTDPTAIYNSKTNKWASGPSVPSVCGSGTSPCDLADAPGALLPNGNILFAASSGYGVSPTHFFEFTTSNTIQQVSDPLHYSTSSGAYYYNFLVLPNGQILMTDFSSIPEVYTPSGTPVSGLAPTITSAPSTMIRGHAYRISGTQLSGRTQGAYYGDDSQTWSNMPIVRITNTATGAVVYARTYKHSNRSVAANVKGATEMQVPAGAATGPSSLSVIANGMASTPVSVTIN